MPASQKTKSVRKKKITGDEGITLEKADWSQPIPIEAIRAYILTSKCSIDAALLKFDVDECKARRALFRTKVTNREISKAVDYYDKGYPFNEACVYGKISPAVLKKFLNDRTEKKKRTARNNSRAVKKATFYEL